MTLTRDVIYQLKMEYGEKATFTINISSTTNLDTGVITPVIDSVTVKRAIKLENHFRQALLKILGAEKAGFQLVGDFQVFIDRNDLKGKTIKIEDSISMQYGSGTIVRIDEFDSAFIFSVNR